MPRYIDAEKVNTNIVWMPTANQMFKEELNRQKTADVAPVVHAHWWLEREPDGTPYCFHCSHCDADGHNIGNTVASDYCPECGAKMDEEEK